MIQLIWNYKGRIKMIIYNEKTLNNLAYRKLYLFSDYHIINSTHLFDDGTIPYIKHRPYIDRLKERIRQSDGGAILITGFRGVGKSTLIHNAISELNKEKKALKIVKATIILSSEKSYSEILFEIIRRLYEILIKENIWEQLSFVTQNRIKLAYARTSLRIKHSENLGIESEISSPSTKNLNPLFKGKTTSQVTDEAIYLAFSEQDIEYELMQIIETISSENMSIKTVIIFDEIDKLTCNESGINCFETMLSRMKNLISATTSLFVFVAGIDIYEKWEVDREKINSLYDSLFHWHLYLPCVWDSVELIFDIIKEKEYVYEPIDSSFQEFVNYKFTQTLQLPFKMIRDYIFFKGKGIPRKIISIFNDFVSWDKKQPYFLLTSKLTKGILQISKLCEKFYIYVNKNTFRTVIEKDIYCSVFLSMLDYLFFRTDFEFTKDELTTALLYENELFILNFDKVVETLLHVFIDEKIIKDNGVKYEVIDASILLRDQSLSVLDANILIDHSDNLFFDKQAEKESSIDERFHEQIDILKYEDVTNFWKPFNAKSIIAASPELMSFQVENIINGDKNLAVLYTPHNRDKIRKVGNLYKAGSYRIRSKYLIDTTDIIKDGAPATSLRKAVEGYSLKDMLVAKFKEKYIYLIMKQILDFLDDLHNKNFFNIKLKPNNILICRNGSIKILDLQHICNINGDLTPYPTRIYSAPEIYYSIHDFSSDFYSAGILLFELILGVNLDNICFERHIDINNYFEKIKCSKKLWKVLLKATSFDISNRYSSSKMFLDALNKCPEFRRYKKIPYPQSEEGIVTNHIIIQKPLAVRSAIQTSKQLSETSILGAGYFGVTSMLSNHSLNTDSELSFPYLLRRKTNEIVKINKTVFRIGKEKGMMDYYIDGNPSISREHACIFMRKGKYFIQDNDSTNGTYINEMRINSRTDVALNDKDIIRLANEELIFNINEKGFHNNM